MKKKIIVVSILLAIVLLLSGCSLFDGQSYTLYRYIDTMYSLAEQDEIDAYTGLSPAQIPMTVASIVMPSTYEIECNITFSYSALQSGVFYPGGAIVKEVVANEISEATGVLINNEGYIVTNAHVVTVENESTYRNLQYKSWTINVNSADSQQKFEATLMAYDVSLDLALIKITDKSVNLPSLKPAVFFKMDNPDSEIPNKVSLCYGEQAIAIGNAYGYGLSVTEGLVSAPHRVFTDGNSVMHAIQTSATINKGSSGGPLCNAFGRVIGINTFKLAQGTSENMGFAIPTYVIFSYIDNINTNHFTGVVLGKNMLVRYYFTTIREYNPVNTKTNMA